MRILTWNINGIRTLPQYHPWNTFKSFNDILNYLQADIICFQETKASRSSLPESVAIPDSYHSFFTFPVRKTGYSGVAVYTRIDSVIPIKAEEGLSGFIQPKPPLTDEERISARGVYPPALDEGLDFDLNFTELESEGRALAIDFGLFVLINVYCPNDGNGTEERNKFKMDFHRLLELRIRGLVEKGGREVMVVGDVNACAAVIDHCEGPLMVSRGQAMGMEGEEGFWEKDCRRWLRDLLVHQDYQNDARGGYLVDIVRRFWPDRKGMYTCWNTKIFARESNYGTRIDYILITKGLVPWIKSADVQQDIKGSDHCPVFIDLHDKIINGDGSITRLRDVLSAPSGDAPPRIAAKYWDEFSGKQTQLHKFFVKKAPSQSSQASAYSVDFENLTDNSPQATTVESTSSKSIMSSDDISSEVTIPSQSQTSTLPPPSQDVTPLIATATATATATTTTTTPHNLITTPAAARSVKRKLLSETPLEKVKKQKGKRAQKKREASGMSGQTTLSGFYTKPKAVVKINEPGMDETPSSIRSSISRSQEGDTQAPASCALEVIDVDDFPDDVESVNENQLDMGFDDSPIATPPCSSQGSASFFSPPSNDAPDHCSKNNGSNGNGKESWSAILAPTPVPRCKVHNEPAKEFTVKKPGPNKGKRFFICSRPVGPGYDKGLAERPREEVDPRYRCNFFKWSSDARKEVRRLGGVD